MIKYLLCFFILVGVLQSAIGQIITPVTKANFGVDAELSCNYFNGFLPTGDDWFGNGFPGTGEFVIDTTGAAAIVAAYTSNPATRGLSFSRLMRQAPYSVVSNQLLLDAIFTRDFHGIDSTVFASGSNKNAMSPADWNCPVAQGIPDKNDVLEAFTHVRRAGPNVTDSLWMFAALSIENTTGSRYVDFELYQTNIVYNRSIQTFSGYGPDAGHTSWRFDATGNVITPGDIIFTAEFGSSTLTLVEARIWINKTTLSITPATFKWGGAFDGDGSGAVYGYANILPKTAGAFYTGLQNSAATSWAGPFAVVRVNNSVLTSYIKNQFLEFSVNLTKLGIEPASFGNPCGSPFRRVLVKTRSSTSFTSELKDFVAPYSMFDYPKVAANAFIRYFCGTVTMPPTTINVNNPIATSTYTWTTTNGNIVGPATGTAITVDAPGTYYVSQQLNTQCSPYSKDSVTMYFYPVCTILDVNFTKFNARSYGQETELKWQVNSNEMAANYVIEYSTDNRVFNELAAIPANEKSGIADYVFRYLPNTSAAAIFYRIRAVSKNQVTKYSSTILFKTGNDAGKAPLIFPNPTQGETWISLESSRKSVVYIYIIDMTGRAINTLKIPVKQGNNLLPLHGLAELAAGMYIVKIKSNNRETTQKVLLSK